MYKNKKPRFRVVLMPSVKKKTLSKMTILKTLCQANKTHFRPLRNKEKNSLLDISSGITRSLQQSI
jgi:hypothetical protein